MNQKLFEALKNFRNASHTLNEVWLEKGNDLELVEKYPFNISFDDLVESIEQWYKFHSQQIDKNKVYKIWKYGCAYTLLDETLFVTPIYDNGEIDINDWGDVDFYNGFTDDEKKEFIEIIEIVTGWRYGIDYK